jgi:hypothetical protein
MVSYLQSTHKAALKSDSRNQRCPTGFCPPFGGVQCRLLRGKDRHSLQEGVRDHGSFRISVVSRHFITDQLLTYKSQ